MCKKNILLSGFIIFVSSSALFSGCSTSCQNSGDQVSDFNYQPRRSNRAGRRALRKTFGAPSSRKKSEGKIVRFDGIPPSPQGRTRPRIKKFSEVSGNPLVPGFIMASQALAAQAKLKEKLSDPEFDDYLATLGIVDKTALPDKELEALLTDFEISKEDGSKSEPICTENKPVEQK